MAYISISLLQREREKKLEEDNCHLIFQLCAAHLETGDRICPALPFLASDDKSRNVFAINRSGVWGLASGIKLLTNVPTDYMFSVLYGLRIKPKLNHLTPKTIFKWL
ncbi:hypothetical protein XENTR_v10021956 [Xenopus tropicalis]|nr:hypothetical protein XENTR_v10021956 [Xenopus tropicalis]